MFVVAPNVSLIFIYNAIGWTTEPIRFNLLSDWKVETCQSIRKREEPKFYTESCGQLH